MKNDKDKCVNAKCEEKAVKGGLCDEHNETLEEVATEDLHNESEELKCSKCGKAESECQFNRKQGKCYSCVAKDRYTDKKDGKSKSKNKTSGPSLPDAAADKDDPFAAEENPRSGKSRGTNRDAVDAVSSSSTASSPEVAPSSLSESPRNYYTGGAERKEAIINFIEEQGLSFIAGSIVNLVAIHEHVGDPIALLCAARRHIDRLVRFLDPEARCSNDKE